MGEVEAQETDIGTIQRTMIWRDQHMKNWKRLFLIIGLALACAALLLSAAAESNDAPVPIDPAHFPDDNFRAYVSEEFDTDSDGILSEDEIAGAKTINFPWRSNIASLVGVKYFTELEYLYCSGNQLTDLDVSGCTALKELACNSNQLSTLNVSGCAALDNLWCQSNQLSVLDVSDCTALEELRCNDNQLSVLDVSDCTALKKLECYGNELSTLGVSGCTALKELRCNDNQLSVLDVSGCVALEELRCSKNRLNELDVGHCEKLWVLNCGSNRLSELDVSNCAELDYLDCCDNQLNTLDVSNCPWLWELYCSSNQLCTLDVRECMALRILDCKDNQLTTLSLSTDLQSLDCRDNALTSLDFLHSPLLLWFYNEEEYFESDGYSYFGYEPDYDYYGAKYDSDVVVNGGEKPYRKISLEHIKAIEDEAFENSGINLLYIENCESIGSRAFADCKDLHIVMFQYEDEDFEPRIADDAFKGCDNLYCIGYFGNMWEWAENHGIPFSGFTIFA